MAESGTTSLLQTHPEGMILNARYEVTRLLGYGDFGKVYQARDLQATDTSVWVAIKQMPMQSIVDCERQADIRTTMQHPAIPRIYDYFSSDAYAYLVQDLIAGWDLESVLERQDGFLPEERVLNWGIQLCDFLDYLHNHPDFPMIFRDLKPNNIMVDAADRIHVVDFGLARVFPPGYFQNAPARFAHFRKGLAIGTVGYSPPEQYEGLALPESDIFALGATLYHLLTRRDPRRNPPFTFSEFPVQVLNPAISSKFADIVMRSLNLDIDKRFSSAKEMKLALCSVTRDQM
jgi:eukaryotic-like serine/threonine-protein kinase